MVHSSACFLSTCQQVHILSLHSIYSIHACHTGYHAVYLPGKRDLSLVESAVHAGATSGNQERRRVGPQPKVAQEPLYRFPIRATSRVAALRIQRGLVGTIVLHSLIEKERRTLSQIQDVVRTL